MRMMIFFFFLFQAEDGIRCTSVTGVQTCALPICQHACGCAPTARSRRPRGVLKMSTYVRISTTKIGRASSREREEVVVGSGAIRNEVDNFDKSLGTNDTHIEFLQRSVTIEDEEV